MSKTYKAKKIRNLHDLHLEQARVKQAYKNIEQNLVSSVISPDTVLAFVLNSIVARKNKKTPARRSQQSKSRPFLNSLFTKKKRAATATPKGFSALSGKKKKSYKKLGRSLMLWQIASLALFVGVNIFRYYKNEKSKGRISSSRQSSKQH